VNNLNNYYDVSLKEYRLSLLNKFKDFRFYQKDIEDLSALKMIFKK